MPTEAQLKAEPWWNAETIPPSIDTLADKLAAHYGVPRSNFGIRGNTAHLKGYHRSRAWIFNSQYCTSRTYSVSRTAGDHSGGLDTDCCALDSQVPSAQLIQMCKNLDVAVRAGRLEKVTEWYGTFGDDDHVDGYDNIANRVATSDSSHLWHLHISFDRGAARNSHADLFDILTGGVMAGSAIWNEDIIENLPNSDPNNPTVRTQWALRDAWHKAHAANLKIDALRTEVAALKVEVGKLGDPAAIAAAVAKAITSDPNVIGQFLDAIRDEIRRNMEVEVLAEATWAHLKSKL